MFEGNRCPYCGKVFTSSDDIVVCPECGTPHHRDCYKEHNSCANTLKHGTFVWAPDQSSGRDPSEINTPVKKELNEDSNEIICSICGQHNLLSSKYCSKCGNLLNAHPNTSFNKRYKVIEVEQVSTDEKIDGIPIKDWLVYLGPTAVSHIRTFIKQNNTNSKFGFSIGAFFFPVLFYLYYKAWDIAAIVLIVDIICNAPTILLQFNYPIASMIGMSAAKFSSLADILAYSYLALILLLSLFAKTIIRKKSATKIKKIRRSCTNETEYSSLLAKKSCPNLILVSIILVIYILSFLFLLFT